MRQVPAPTYLIIGSGRVAQHFQCYLSLLQLPFESWSRQQNNAQDLVFFSKKSSVVLLLISDQAIASFVEQCPFLKEKNLVHFSGALAIEGIHSAHPLMTFTPGCYDLATYQKIPFILSTEGPAFAQLLPGLPNAAYHVPEQLRPYYHALCVLSGNFTALLWQKFFKELEGRFQLPKEVAHPYLQQVMQNLLGSTQQALTGPLMRGDQKTITANLQALESDDFQKIYQAFVEVYQTKKTARPT